MKHLKVMGVLAVALAVLAGPALAETQTVKVSGSLDIIHLYRDDFDLRSGNEASVVPAGSGVVPTSPTGAASASYSDDAADWFMSIVQIEVAADLTDNVSVVINLFNQRDWNAHTWCVPAIGQAQCGANTIEEFDVGIDLAYVQMKEIFYAPLTLTMGRQDIEFGRGLIFGNFQIQDPQGTIVADEYSAVTSFDAFRATLDFEPWTIDFVAANPALGGAAAGQGDPNDEDDRWFWWVNVNYQFAEYNAEWEGYIALDHDRATNSAAASPTVRGTSVDKTYVVGTRAQYDPVENLTVGGEVAYQWGDFYGGTNPLVLAQDREAWLLNLFGTYTWLDNAYTPWLGLEYVYLSGDERGGGDFEGWNGLFRSPTYGVIREYLDVIYQTALSTDAGITGPTAVTNHQHFAVSGGLSPMEDLSLDGTFYWFWTDEDVITSVASGSQNLGDEVGTELDLNVTYAYTEDVTFGVGLAFFWPGDIYDNYTVQQTPGGVGHGPVNDNATSITSSVNVVF